MKISYIVGIVPVGLCFLRLPWGNRLCTQALFGVWEDRSLRSCLSGLAVAICYR